MVSYKALNTTTENEDTSEASEIGKQLLQMLHPSNVLKKVIELHLTSLSND